MNKIVVGMYQKDILPKMEFENLQSHLKEIIV